jgi:hypothetical protein
MKKTLLILSAALIGFNVAAQKIPVDNVPAAVLATFKARFSIAEKTDWEIEYDNYEANFTVGKADFSAQFDKEGKWLETETFMKPSDLPKTIKDVLTKKYGELSAYKIDEAKKVETEKDVVYVLQIMKGEVGYNLEINEKGNISKDEIKTDK